jgi:hypothetical protein
LARSVRRIERRSEGAGRINRKDCMTIDFTRYETKLHLIKIARWFAGCASSVGDRFTNSGERATVLL